MRDAGELLQQVAEEISGSLDAPRWAFDSNVIQYPESCLRPHNSRKRPNLDAFWGFPGGLVITTMLKKMMIIWRLTMFHNIDDEENVDDKDANHDADRLP